MRIYSRMTTTHKLPYTFATAAAAVTSSSSSSSSVARKRRIEDVASVEYLDYKRVRDALSDAKTELESARVTSSAMRELRYTHPVRALELAAAAEEVARRSTELALRLRISACKATPHDAFLPLEVWHHVIGYLARPNVLLGVSRELTALAMSRYRGQLRLSSRRLFESHKGGRKGTLPTWSNACSVKLWTHDDVHQDEWRTVCATLPQLLDSRKLVLSGTASNFLYNYDTTLCVDQLDVSLDRHACAMLCAMTGNAHVLRVFGEASPFGELLPLRCSARVLDMSKSDWCQLFRVLRAAVAAGSSDIRFEHVFVYNDVIAPIRMPDCALLSCVGALHIISATCIVSIETVHRIMRNSRVKLYFHVVGSSHTTTGDKDGSSSSSSSSALSVYSQLDIMLDKYVQKHFTYAKEMSEVRGRIIVVGHPRTNYSFSFPFQLYFTGVTANKLELDLGIALPYAPSITTTTDIK